MCKQLPCCSAPKSYRKPLLNSQNSYSKSRMNCFNAHDFRRKNEVSVRCPKTFVHIVRAHQPPIHQPSIMLLCTGHTRDFKLSRAEMCVFMVSEYSSVLYTRVGNMVNILYHYKDIFMIHDNYCNIFRLQTNAIRSGIFSGCFHAFGNLQTFGLNQKNRWSQSGSADPWSGSFTVQKTGN